MNQDLNFAGTTDQSLSDDEYLNKFISYTQLFRTRDICSIKDTTSTYLAITPTYAKMLGFNLAKDIIGKKDEDLPRKIAKFAYTFYTQDRVVEQSKKPIQIINIMEYCTGLAAIRAVKEPIINPASGNVLGTFTHNTKFTIENGLKTILNIYNKPHINLQSKLQISCSFELPSLGAIETDVLFSICLGFSTRKAIANFLTLVCKKPISVENTVHDAVRRLCKKLACTDLSHLVEFAIINSLHTKIPHHKFLPIGSFIIKEG
jgi:hypothetical protein